MKPIYVMVNKRTKLPVKIDESQFSGLILAADGKYDMEAVDDNWVIIPYVPKKVKK